MNHRRMLVWLEECASPTTLGATLMMPPFHMMELSVSPEAHINLEYLHE